MKIKIVLKFLGLVTASVALWMFIPLLWAYVYATGDVKLFFISASAGFAVAGLLYTLGRNASLKEIGSREAFAAVTFSWIAASAIGTFPYWFGGTLSFSDAFFEAMSGFSSTGGTMIVNLESCTQSLLLWRSLTQWLGGMGIILLALAIIPMGGSSLQLYRAEIPGPVQERLTPRIQQTALFLWGVYLTLTIAELLLLLLSGLSFFDALTHSFATISTGGFSTHSAGIGHFKSAQVEWVITLFMFLSGTNFTLYYLALSNKRVSAFLEDPEFRFYGSILFFGSLIIFAILMASGNRDSILDTFSHSLFQIVSVVTTSGFFTEDYTLWPLATQYILFILMFSGACAISTGGGITNIRVLIILRHAKAEFKRLIHPRAIVPVRLGKRTIEPHVVSSCFAFIVAYLTLWILAVIFVTSQGIDLTMSLSGAAAMLGNIGPALDAVGPGGNYAAHPESVKWCYSFLMLCGRLEIHTPLILFLPSVWKN